MPLAPAPRIELVRPSEVVGAQFLRAGVYGEVGTGKSTVAASCDQYVERLIAEGKWVRGKPYMWVLSAFPENIKPFLVHEEHFLVSRLSDWRQMQQVVDFLTQNLLLPDGRVNPASQEPGAFFRAACFDTWTRFLSFAAWLKTGISLPPVGQEQQYLENLSRNATTYNTWLDIGELSKIWMQFFTRLPIHLLFNFQEELREGKFEETPVMTGPALTPYAARAAREDLEILGRLYVKGTAPTVQIGQASSDLRAINEKATEERYLLLGKHDRYYTKGPTHALGYALANPSWEKLVGSIGAPPAVFQESPIVMPASAA